MIPNHSNRYYSQAHRYQSALLLPNRHIIVGCIENPEGHVPKFEEPVKVNLRKYLLRYSVPKHLIPRKYLTNPHVKAKMPDTPKAPNMFTEDPDGRITRSLQREAYAKYCRKYILIEHKCYHLGNISLFCLHNPGAKYEQFDENSENVLFTNDNSSNDTQERSLLFDRIEMTEDNLQDINTPNRLASSLSKERVYGPAIVIFWDDRSVRPRDIIQLGIESDHINLDIWKNELVNWWEFFKSSSSYKQKS